MSLLARLYRHYKDVRYRTICLAMHTETGEMFTIYRSMKDWKFYARPRGMFEGKVTVNDTDMPRFTVADDIVGAPRWTAVYDSSNHSGAAMVVDDKSVMVARVRDIRLARHIVKLLSVFPPDLEEP